MYITKVPLFPSILLDPIVVDSIGTPLGGGRLLRHVGLDVEVAEEDDEGDLVADVGLDHPRGEVAVLGEVEVDHLEEGAEKLNHLRWRQKRMDFL